ncbi:MAG: MerR family transcriptional regulator [Streptosporangiales bacterium]|nr:MerR family transcriptional regulator [Streptosporangiales bacterium]
MAEYRIDELAQAGGATVRNIRVYQDRGLLPPPRREGRVGIYTDVHLARLRLIGSLLERGFTMAHISELLTAWEHGRDLSHVLGLESALVGPWSQEVPTYRTADELRAMMGGAVTAEQLDRAVRLGLIEPEGDRYTVPSPRLLHAGAELVRIGVSMDDVLDIAERLRADTDRIAARFVGVVAEQILASKEPGWLPSDRELPELAELVERLRPLVGASVQASLAASMDRAVTRWLGDRVTELTTHESDRRRSG